MAKKISAVSDLAMLKWAKLEDEGVSLEKRIKAYNGANELLRGDGFNDEERKTIFGNAQSRYKRIARGEVIVMSPEISKSLGL